MSSLLTRFKHLPRPVLLLIIILFTTAIIFTIFLITHTQTSDPTTDNPTTDSVGTLPAASGQPTDSATQPTESVADQNHYNSSNCTTAWGALTLINPNFTVDTDYISQRQKELIDLTATYNIAESGGNGAPYLDAEAAQHLNDLNNAYKESNPGHTLTTRSCFRSKGTTCGRLCAATGTSDHHTGYTCDLIDPTYGTILDTDYYNDHPDWQWLRAHAHEYGFIDRFPEAWAGGSMSEPVNVNADGSTGLFETWHYRYVGLTAAREIATGRYNDGAYDSLEHYLKATNRLTTLTDMSTACHK